MQAYKVAGKRNEKKNVINISPIRTEQTSSITFYVTIILCVSEK